MAFQKKSTLVQPATSNFPVRQWLDTRDPVSGVGGDFKNFEIFDMWVNFSAERIWFMVDKTATTGTWIQAASTGTGILTITGDSGGAVPGDGANNINLLGSTNLTIAGDMGTSTLTVSLGGAVSTSFPTDSGTATPSSGVLNILGTGGTTTSGAGNTVTVTSGPTVPTFFVTDAGTATPALNTLNVLGDGAITTSGVGATLTIHAGATIATTYTCDSGTATPAANNLNVIGSGGLSTTGSGDTITIASTGVSWTEVTVVGPTAMVINHGYVSNSASRVELTLPLTSVFGSIIRVVGKGSGGWQIDQNAGQSIITSGSSTTVGVTGTLKSSEQYAAVEILCTVADTTWTVISSVGNLIFT